MGTSTSLPTPTGGGWTKVKNDITDYLGGNHAVTPDQIIGGTIHAAGGLGTRGASAPGAAGGGGGGGGGGRSGSGGRAAVGRAASGLGGFAAAVRDRGLDEGLRTLGLDELRGRPAAEVIARIAEHLAEDTPGLQGELLSAALRDAILEAAALEGDRGYQNLSDSLQAYLNREGVDGLVESYLTHYVFDRVWSCIQSHVDRKSDGLASASALGRAVESGCRAHVHALIEDMRDSRRFDGLDWFGRDGQALGQEIAETLEARLTGLRPS
jgi:hypothetical protein